MSTDLRHGDRVTLHLADGTRFDGTYITEGEPTPAVRDDHGCMFVARQKGRVVRKAQATAPVLVDTLELEELRRLAAERNLALAELEKLRAQYAEARQLLDIERVHTRFLRGEITELRAQLALSHQGRRMRAFDCHGFLWDELADGRLRLRINHNVVMTREEVESAPYWGPLTEVVEGGASRD